MFGCRSRIRPRPATFGFDERRHDQGRNLRIHSRRVRSPGQPTWSASVIALSWRHHRRHGNPLRHDGKGSEAPARLQYDRKHRIIFVSLGLALAFQANDLKLPAALAFTAALFHVLNHSFFKSLLFFGAGAVLTSTGERDMDNWGPDPSDATHQLRLSGWLPSRSRRCRHSTASFRNG